MKKFIYLLLGGLLSALGFASCDGEGGLVEYGTPHADFKNDIMVTDEAGKPIKGIRLTTVKTGDGVGYPLLVDTLYTDRNGKAGNEYQLGSVPKEYRLKFEDVDGEENGGKFATDTADFEVKQVGEDHGWVTGSYEATGTKVLKKSGK